MAIFVNRKLLNACLLLPALAGLTIMLQLNLLVCAKQVAMPALRFVKEDATSGLKEYRLRTNGLTVLLQEQHDSPVVTVMVMYKVGSRNEAVGYTGSTHFLEHMMFKGTPRHEPKKGTGFDDILKPIGGVNNASTSFDRTDYVEVVPARGLSACLDLEADRMRHALIRESDRKSEMTVVRNELERGENTAATMLETQVFATAFREHPYHHPPIGWRSDVENVPIRRLQKFYNDFYYPNNATLLVLGDFNTPDALSLINKYFAGVPASPTPFAQVYTKEPAQEGERRFVIQRGDELPKILIGYHIPSAVNADTHTLEVLASLLGDQKRQSSRLYKRLVDTGLATQASALNISMRDPGLFTIYASATSGTRLETIEKTIEDELVSLAKEPVPDTELDRARKVVWKKMKLEANDPADYAQQLSDAQAVADWTWLINAKSKIKAVTAAQVQAVAKKYFSSANRTVGFYLPREKSSQHDEAKPEPSKDKTLPQQQLNPATTEGRAVKDPDQASKSSTIPDNEAPSWPSLQAKSGDIAGTPAAASLSQKGPIAARTKKKILANGMIVYVLPVHGSGIVAVSAKIRGGNSGAPPDKTLLPALVGEMLDKGSKNISKEQLADTLDTMACSLDSEVEPFWTAIDSEVVVEDLDRYLAVLSESIHNPLFLSQEFEKVKKQKESELKDQMVETADLAANKLLGLIYKPGCVYYQPCFEENFSELSRINIDDLKNFHKKRYVAGNVTLALAGDLSPEEGFHLVEKHFGSWEKGIVADLSTDSCRCLEKFKVKQIVSRLPDKANVDIVMGYPAHVSIKSKDFCAAQLANAALGHNALSSRLAAVREKHGLSYDIHSMFSDNAEPWSPWVIQLSVNPENVERALKLVNGIVSDYVAGGITPRELSLEKQRIAGEYIVYRMRTPKHLADALSKYGTLGMEPNFMDRYPHMLDCVTLKEANAAIARYMQVDRLVTSLAGSVPANIKNK